MSDLIVGPHAEPRLQPAESVVANHTAAKMNGNLSRSYLVQSTYTGVPLVIADMAITAVALLVSSYVVNLSQGHGFNSGTWTQLPALLLLQFGLISLHGLYPGAGISPVYELRGIVRSTFLAALSLSTINILFGQLPRIEFAIFACTAVMIAVLLPLARHLTRTALAKTSWWGIGTLLIGTASDGSRICSRIQSLRQSGFKLIGYVCRDFENGHSDSNCLGPLDDAYSIASLNGAPVAAIASSEIQESAHRLMFQFPSLVWIGNSSTAQESSDVLGAFTRRLNMPFLRFVPRFCKRALDLMIVIPGLVALAPLFAILAIAIKRRSPGPVIYGSNRVGQHGRRFKMWKFRSMVVGADEVLKQKLASDPVARAEWDRDSKLKDDPRIIAGVGHMLRRFSLDELPQLWNVLTGEMSLVGPRPVPPDEIVRYQAHYYEYTQMWPGMTGLWQVSGRNETTFETRVFLVHHYAANWSLWLDAWILVKTPLTVLTRRGAY
ncbi:UDP-glucose:undecaprenyl-phosphate glucose-1-phosphate transferase [Rubripirellula reticaptiva]|uniref:UDP-glucose:undecaprenyl-phosphate glucose-1-phosphate transferase n=1 Tax=Rubripirellula reticaptiva TaxID=2528013 RepID=A0A5C6EMJ0_9BACT|nr:UDP-glucose:undecaprenyl-phosphate glucose-1-phosphate transferase [Rubripirellula reticaptiva]